MMEVLHLINKVVRSAATRWKNQSWIQVMVTIHFLQRLQKHTLKIKLAERTNIEYLGIMKELQVSRNGVGEEEVAPESWALPRFKVWRGW